MELTQKEMYEVSGGTGWQIIAGLSAIISFVVGFFSGYTNPNKCNN